MATSIYGSGNEGQVKKTKMKSVVATSSVSEKQGINRITRNCTMLLCRLDALFCYLL